MVKMITVVDSFKQSLMLHSWVIQIHMLGKNDTDFTAKLPVSLTSTNYSPVERTR